MFKKIILFAAMTTTLGCGSDKSNPKDYWQLNEPEVYVWDTNEESSLRGFNLKVSAFNSSEMIKGSLGYGSFVQFSNLTPENTFDILTICRNDIKSSSVEFQNIKVPTSLKLYFYNYLPNEVLHDSEYSNSAPDFKCDFRFTAKNRINSNHSFFVKDININTFISNILDVVSLNKSENSVARSIRRNAPKSKLEMPSIYYSNETHTFLLKNTLDRAQLVGPGKVQCLGSNNIFFIESQNGSLLTSMSEPFFHISKKQETPFLKKCRVFAQIRFPSDDSVAGSSYANEVRTVWSEYFNVIFEEPKFEIEVTKLINDSNDVYPYNTGDYLDNALVLYELKVKNPTAKHIKIHLPSEQKIEGIISPIIYSIQQEDFKLKETRFWQGLDYYELPEKFNTEIRFVKDGRRVIEIDLKPNSSFSFNMEINKNFNCKLKPHKDYYRLTSQEQTSERGFRLKAIELDSPQNILRIEYQNQNKMDLFPYSISFDQFLKQSILSSTSEDSSSNPLQMIVDDKSTAIDIVFLRTTNDLIYPQATKENPWDVPHDVTYLSIQNEVRSIKEKNRIPEKIEILETQMQFCQQLY